MGKDSETSLFIRAGMRNAQRPPNRSVLFTGEARTNSTGLGAVHQPWIVLAGHGFMRHDGPERLRSP